MLNEPCWITAEGVIQINKDILSEGERHVLRDQDLLESACHRPKHAWALICEDDVATLATLLAFGIAKNHPFEQGNKRTAFAAMVGFLAINGFALRLRDDTACSSAMLAVIVGQETEEQFADSLRRVIEMDDPREWV